jgi:hypothetical protein
MASGVSLGGTAGLHYNSRRDGADSWTKLGRYEEIGPLVMGGMGEVYWAKDTRLDME